MWKKLDDKDYNFFVSKIEGNNTGIFVFLGIIIILTSFLTFNSKWYNWSERDKFICLLIFVGMLLIVVVFGIEDRIFWSKNKDCLEENHAEYCKAFLVSKKHTEPDNYNMFKIVADINGKRRKIRCTSDVFRLCEKGEKIIVVDIAGRKARSMRTCIAVAESAVENPEDLYIEKESVSDTQEYENTYPHYIRPDERDIFIKEERKNYIKAIIPPLADIIVFLIDFFVLMPLLFIFPTESRVLNEIAIIVVSVFGFSFPLAFLHSAKAFYKLKVSKQKLYLLKNSNVVCEKVVYRNSEYISIWENRLSKKRYYHLCINNAKDRVSFESSVPVSAKQGEKITAVIFSNDDTGLYKV